MIRLLIKISYLQVYLISEIYRVGVFGLAFRNMNGLVWF